MLSRSSLETQKLELMSAMSELKLQQAALERENIELRTSHYTINGNHIPMNNVKKPPLIPRTSPIPQHTSTPNNHHQLNNSSVSPSPSPITVNNTAASPARIESEENHTRVSFPYYQNLKEGVTEQ